MSSKKIFFLKPLAIFLTVLISVFSLETQTHAIELEFEPNSSLDLVQLQVAFRGGASSDPVGKNGLNYITGKLFTRGTKTKTKSQIDLAIDQLGSSIEIETRAEVTILRASVISKSLPSFLSLLLDIIVHPSFRPEEIEKLKKETVSQLLDQLGNDRALAATRFEQFFFKGHPYSMSNQGRIADIQALQRKDIIAQHSSMLNSGKILVFATGNTKRESLESFVAQLEKNCSQSTQTVASIPAFKNEPQKLKVVIFDKPERTQTQVVIGQLGLSISDPKVDALSVANYTFGGGGFQSRLMKELRVKRGWTYGAGSGLKLASQPHIWKAAFFPKNADTPAAIAQALQMIRELHEQGLSKEEFEFAKSSMINGAGFSFNTSQKRMENALVEKIYNLPKGHFQNLAERLQKLDLSDVNEAISASIKPNQLMIGVVATAKISRAEIAKALKISENDIEVVDYRKE